MNDVCADLVTNVGMTDYYGASEGKPAIWHQSVSTQHWVVSKGRQIIYGKHQIVSTEHRVVFVEP